MGKHTFPIWESQSEDTLYAECCMVSQRSFVFSFLTVQCHHERNLCKQEQQGELLWAFCPLLDLSGTVETTRSGHEECRVWFTRKGRRTQEVQKLPQCYRGAGGISHPSDHLGRLQDSKPQISCVYVLYWVCMAKFCSGWAIGVASVRSYQDFLLFLTEPVPAPRQTCCSLKLSSSAIVVTPLG